MSDEAVNRRLVELIRTKRVRQACSILLNAAGVSTQVREIPVPVERIVRSQGIRALRQSMVADGYLSKSGDKFLIFVNSERDAITRRFIIGHEFAHWVMAERCGIISDVPAIPNWKETIERLCDEFASILLVPSSYMADVIKEHPGQITFGFLENLSRRFQAPLRGILSGVWRSGALTSRGMCILVLRAMSNPWTHKEWELRVWRAFCPNSCFVPESRAQKIGLSAITAAWVDLHAGRQFTLRENINVYSPTLSVLPANDGSQIRSGTGVHWRQYKTNGVEVQYKVYLDAAEGLFVVGLFPWNGPSVPANREMRSS
jgi:hypothetical protein